MTIKRFWQSIFYKDTGFVEVPKPQPSITDMLQMLSEICPNSVVKFVVGHTEGYGGNVDPIPDGFLDLEIFRGDDVRVARVPFEHIDVIETVVETMREMEHNR